MNIKYWIVGSLFYGLQGCTDENASKRAQNFFNTPTFIQATVKFPQLLEQNWDRQTRMQWWYSPIGARVMPYSWFLALEKSDSTTLVRSSENLEHYRFIAGPKDPELNPDGLPIGFVNDVDLLTETQYLGVNCAVCHTGKMRYQGHEFLLEGAPAHQDFDLFMTEIAVALQKTVDDKDKFNRFTRKVLGFRPAQDEISSLKTRLLNTSIKMGERMMVNHPTLANGYGRLDVADILANEFSVFALGLQENKTPVNAPVSYPVLWNTPQQHRLQWTAATVNTGMGLLVHNVSKMLGLFANLHLAEIHNEDASAIDFKHTLNIAKLEALQNHLGSLASPIWPEQILPALDPAKYLPGKTLYAELCIDCHKLPPQRTTNAAVEDITVPQSKIGTDALAADNVASVKVKTGRLAQPDSSNPMRLGTEAFAFELVQYSALAVINQNLQHSELARATIEKQAQETKIHCTIAAQTRPCFTLPSYKARPLNGVWASAPYLHNGSVANLWQLLQSPAQRLTKFNVGSWEFDPVNVGYVTEQVNDSTELNTAIPGNSNAGHDYGTALSNEL